MTTQCHTRTLGRKTGVNPATRRAFHRDLLRWYQRHHRKLPWRTTRDPYKIWVSEIMLQQTRVDVVRDYYRRWLRAFPTVESLAKARYSRVLKLWEGLGYYTRAKNLHRAAKMIVGRASAPRRTAGPVIPTTVSELRQLPGIGRYTVGAIASIAFNQRVPLVDGNVARVFARIFCIGNDVTKPATQKWLWTVAEEILPENNPGVFNQALMELGALVCTPVNPQCVVCPMADVCVAYAKGKQSQLPNRGRRPPQNLVTHDAALMWRDGRILLQRRPAGGLLANMWELPPLDNKQAQRSQPVLVLRHTITNHRITLRIFACGRGARVKLDGKPGWFSARELKKLTLPAAHRRALERIISADRQINGNCPSPDGTILLPNDGKRVRRDAGARIVVSG